MLKAVVPIGDRWVTGVVEVQVMEVILQALQQEQVKEAKLTPE